jgi:hypothetical protein
MNRRRLYLSKIEQQAAIIFARVLCTPEIAGEVLLERLLTRPIRRNKAARWRLIKELQASLKSGKEKAA